VAAVGQHYHAHAGGEAAELEVQLVVEQLAVPQAPGLVLAVGLVAVGVGHLAAVAREREQEAVAGLQRLGRGAQALQQRGARALLREQHGGRVALLAGQRGEVARVVLAGCQRAFPALVVRSADGVQAQVQRQRARPGGGLPRCGHGGLSSCGAAIMRPGCDIAHP
jgi:hypothetical protein